jgi:hypothetical protein
MDVLSKGTATMANANPSRVGQQLGAGDTRALFLKVFSGEVMTVYDANTVMKDKVRVRNISSGKSVQFPAIGRTKASYHTPGTEIVGDIIQQDEKVITIDDLLIADTFVSRIDEAMSQFEVRSEYSNRMGQALAQTYDRNLLSLAVKTARDTGVGGTGVGAVGQGNAVSTGIGASPTVQQIVDAFYAAAPVFDQKFIPDADRYAFVSPAVYWSLVTNDKILNQFFQSGNGDYAKGDLIQIAGFKLIKTPNLALDHTAATATYPDYTGKYTVNASTTAALLMTPEALGTVKLLDLATEMEYDIRRQGTLMVSKMAVGHGVLRPECLYEINKV